MEGSNNNKTTQQELPQIPPQLPPSSNSGNPEKGLAPVPETEEPNSETMEVELHEGFTESAVPNVDSIKLKRIEKSRKYSQTYREKQENYKSQLEMQVKALEAEIAVNGSRVKFADGENKLTRAENSSLKQNFSAYTGELCFKKAECEELKKQRDSLLQLFEFQRRQAAAAAESFNTPAGYQMLNLADLNQPAVHGPVQFNEPCQPAGFDPQIVNPRMVNLADLNHPVGHGSVQFNEPGQPAGFDAQIANPFIGNEVPIRMVNLADLNPQVDHGSNQSNEPGQLAGFDRRQMVNPTTGNQFQDEPSFVDTIVMTYDTDMDNIDPDLQNPAGSSFNKFM